MMEAVGNAITQWLFKEQFEIWKKYESWGSIIKYLKLITFKEIRE